MKRGTWHEARHDCGSPKCAAPVDADGWVIHDYLEYQFSKEQVLADRKKAAERQAKWREAKAGKSGSNAVTRPGMSGNEPIHNGSSNGVTNAVSASSPPRPAPKEAGRAVPAPEPPNGRAIPSGSPSGGRPENKSVAEALRNGIEPGHRASPDAYERGPQLARKLMADRGKPP